MIETVNKICAQLPPGWRIELCMEKDAAWIELCSPNGAFLKLPDPTDRTIVEQMEDALAMAKGEMKA